VKPFRITLALLAIFITMVAITPHQEPVKPSCVLGTCIEPGRTDSPTMEPDR